MAKRHPASLWAKRCTLRVFAALLLVTAATCANAGRNHANAVRHRAARDLRCPTQDIEITPLGRNSYSARGCGANQTYVCQSSTETCARVGTKRLYEKRQP